MILPAISIKEPWASMIRSGDKSIEVRTWQTKHRGRIILCASAKPESNISGHAFALADLLDVRPMVPEDRKKTGGVYNKAAFSWILGNVRLFNPFAVCGKLGVFKIDTVTKTRV